MQGIVADEKRHAASSFQPFGTQMATPDWADHLVDAKNRGPIAKCQGRLSSTVRYEVMSNSNNSLLLAAVAGVAVGAAATSMGVYAATRKHTHSAGGEVDPLSSPPSAAMRTPTTNPTTVFPAGTMGPRQSVTVRVPATTANMGPGYDSIGMALDMWSEVTITRADAFSMTCEGEGSELVPKNETNLVCVGVREAFAAAARATDGSRGGDGNDVSGEEVEVPPLAYHCVNRIPFARGLGSSSAAIVAGLIGGLVLAGQSLQVWGSEQVLQLASRIEGHPDNVAPALYGGIQLGIHTGERWMSARVRTPEHLQMAVFIPERIGITAEARGVLADEVSRRDAVFNIGRSCLLVNALEGGVLQNLRYAMQDALHQPQRGAAMYPHLYPMIQAALEAGALGCYLSGAGPSVLAVISGAAGDIFTQQASERNDAGVAASMLATAEAHGVGGKVFVTQPVQRGAHVVAADPPFSDRVVRYSGNV